MTNPSADDVRNFILRFVADGLAAKRLSDSLVPDDFDLLLEGVIDSFGIIELLGALETEFNVTLDGAEIDVDVLTVLGPLSRYVSAAVEPK